MYKDVAFRGKDIFELAVARGKRHLTIWVKA